MAATTRGVDEEQDFKKVEQETRRARPSTKTLPEVFRVFFSHLSPKIIIALLTGSVVARAVLGALDWADLLWMFSVVLWWPVLEWAAHRWVLHLEPREVLGVTVDPHFARCHRAHHQNPSHFGLVFLPAAIPPSAYGVFFGLIFLISWDLGSTLSFMIGISAGALIYEWVHFLTHTDYVPKTSYFRRIWRNHRLHHYKSEHHWYSFTLPNIDQWMGTGPDDHKSVEKSPTCRTLGHAVTDNP